MALDESPVVMNDAFAHRQPTFHIGQHISERNAPLTDLEYGHLLNFGVSSAAG